MKFAAIFLYNFVHISTQNSEKITMFPEKSIIVKMMHFCIRAKKGKLEINMSPIDPITAGIELTIYQLIQGDFNLIHTRYPRFFSLLHYIVLRSQLDFLYIVF